MKKVKSRILWGTERVTRFTISTHSSREKKETSREGHRKDNRNRPHNIPGKRIEKMTTLAGWQATSAQEKRHERRFLARFHLHGTVFLRKRSHPSLEEGEREKTRGIRYSRPPQTGVGGDSGGIQGRGSFVEILPQSLLGWPGSKKSTCENCGGQGKARGLLPLLTWRINNTQQGRFLNA